MSVDKYPFKSAVKHNLLTIGHKIENLDKVGVLALQKNVLRKGKGALCIGQKGYIKIISS